MYRIIILLPLLYVLVGKSYAQSEITEIKYGVGAGISNSYIWRGLKWGGIGSQISGNINYCNFNLELFGRTSFYDNYRELDFIFSYKGKSFSISLGDYWSKDDDPNKYFTLKNHLLETEILYVNNYIPLTLSWNTVLFGEDFSSKGKRLFSSYLELCYQFTISKFNMECSLGITPWENSILETEKFGLTNLKGSINKEITISNLCMSIGLQYIINPYARKHFGVASINIIWER